MRCPTDYRRALELTDFDGRSQADAARIEGISLSGMKSRVQRGRRQFATLVKQCCDVTTDSRGELVDFHAPHRRLRLPARLLVTAGSPRTTPEPFNGTAAAGRRRARPDRSAVGIDDVHPDTETTGANDEAQRREVTPAATDGRRLRRRCTESVCAGVHLNKEHLP